MCLLGLACHHAQAFGEFKFWSVNDMIRHSPVDQKSLARMRKQQQLLKKIDQNREKGTTSQLLKKLKNLITKKKAWLAAKKSSRPNGLKSNFHHDPVVPKSKSGHKVHMIKIYGDDHLQYYYMNLMMGKPFRQQSVIIDTGSDLTAVPCSKND